MGVKSTIVMPANAPLSKINATVGFGGQVVLAPTPSFDDANALASELCQKNKYTLVPPFDHKDVIAGQGTIGLELMKQKPDLDMVVCQIGGGGLISGVATAVKALNPYIKVIGVQTERFPAMKESFYSKKLEAKALGQPTLADGIAVKMPGKLNYEITSQLVDEIVTISEDDVINAIEFLAEKAKIVTEGAGAAGFAAILSKKIDITGKKVAVIASGGNIDADRLIYVLNKSLTEQNRKFNVAFNLKTQTEVKKLFDVANSTGAKLYCTECGEPITDTEHVKLNKSSEISAYFSDANAHKKFFEKLDESKISYKKI